MSSQLKGKISDIFYDLLEIGNGKKVLIARKKMEELFEAEIDSAYARGREEVVKPIMNIIDRDDVYSLQTKEEGLIYVVSVPKLLSILTPKEVQNE